MSSHHDEAYNLLVASVTDWDNVDKIRLVVEAVRITERLCSDKAYKKEFCLELCRRAIRENVRSNVDIFLMLFDQMAPTLVDQLVAAANGELFKRHCSCLAFICK